MFGHRLRSHERRRPRCAWQKGVCPLKLFAHTKVCYLDVAIISQQQIRWFNVPVNNPLVVYCTKKYRFNINLHYIYIFPVKFIIYVQFYILKLKNSLKLIKSQILSNSLSDPDHRGSCQSRNTRPHCPKDILQLFQEDTESFPGYWRDIIEDLLLSRVSSWIWDRSWLLLVSTHLSLIL